MKKLSRYKGPIIVTLLSIIAFITGICLKLIHYDYSDIAFLLSMFLISSALAWSSFILLKTLKEHPTTL